MAGEKPLEGKVAYVSGASRGIGREIALELSAAGAKVLGNSVDPQKKRRVDEVVGLGGGNIEWIYADITVPGDRGRIVEAAKSLADGAKPDESPKIDFVFLNAAGGLETDKPDGWAKVVNADSQTALVEEFKPHMARGGAVVNVISFWSERFGQVEQLPFYRPVAKTKHLGEVALRGMIPDLSEQDVRMLFLSGNLIRGTGAYNLFKRSSPQLIEGLRVEYQRQTGAEDFPEATDMGRVALDLVTAVHPSGYTGYVGNMELVPIPSKQKDAYTLDRAQIAEALPMYGTKPPYNKLYVDKFNSPADDELGDAKETGTGMYMARRADTAGHFSGAYNDLRLFRGVDQIEMVAQVGGLILLGLESGSSMVPLFTAIEDGDVHWRRMVEPGDKVRIEARITNMNPMKTRVAGEVYTGRSGEKISEFSGLTFALAPSLEYVRTLRARQRASK